MSESEFKSSNEIEYANLLMKEVNPTFVYEWEGQTSNNRIEGKGTFRAKDNQTDQVIFWCEAHKWKNQVPVGEIEYGRVIKIENDPFMKIKERHVYNGQCKNLMKNGKGVYKVEEYFRNGEMKTFKIEG